ncbi:hypothetical protein HDU96_009463 [Phlyctochytrium bullatum]|nr:hypothetical protein HDU96_009463 [Phlyctochytrium bullatum]
MMMDQHHDRTDARPPLHRLNVQDLQPTPLDYRSIASAPPRPQGAPPAFFQDMPPSPAQPPPPSPLLPRTGQDITLETAVLIVGAGPTGLTLAIELARRRVPHILIDTLTQRSPLSKAIALHARTMELLEQLDPPLADRLLSVGYTAPGFDFGLNTSNGGSDSLFVGDKAAGLAGLEDLDTRYPFVLVVPQSETEEALEACYARFGGRIWHGVTLLDSHQDPDGVTCVVELAEEGCTVPDDVFDDCSAASPVLLNDPAHPMMASPPTTSPPAQPRHPRHQSIPDLRHGSYFDPTDADMDSLAALASMAAAASTRSRTASLPNAVAGVAMSPSGTLRRTHMGAGPTRTAYGPSPPTPSAPSPARAASPASTSSRATLTAPPRPRRLHIRSAYLAGCDGTRSRVRTLHGIPYDGNAYPFHGMMADVRLSRDYFVAGVSQFSAPGGVAFVIPFRNGVHRVVTLTWPKAGGIDAEEVKGEGPPAVHPGWTPSTARTPPKATLDDLQATLNAILAHAQPHLPPPTLLHPLWVSGWAAERRLARQFRHRRVFLAGDAAHAHAPIGGQGLNTGLQDAVNLGWKLAGVVAGHVPDRVLDTYAPERRFVAASVNVICDALVWGVMLRGGVARWARDRVVEWAAPWPSVRAFFVGWLSGVGVSYRGVWRVAFPWLPADAARPAAPKPPRRVQTRTGWGVRAVVAATTRAVVGAAATVVASALTLSGATGGGGVALTAPAYLPPVPIFLPTLSALRIDLAPGDRVPDAELTALDRVCVCASGAGGRGGGSVEGLTGEKGTAPPPYVDVVGEDSDVDATVGDGEGAPRGGDRVGSWGHQGLWAGGVGCGSGCGGGVGGVGDGRRGTERRAAGVLGAGWDDEEQAAARAALRVARVVDIRGVARRKTGLGHGAVVVVRPDGYVAFVGRLEDGDRALEMGLMPWLI